MRNVLIKTSVITLHSIAAAFEFKESLFLCKNPIYIFFLYKVCKYILIF